MSWTWPKHRFVSGRVFDLDAWNENLASFATEVDGNLSEWNFDRAAGRDIDFQAEDGCLEYKQVTREVSPLGSTSSMLLLPQSEAWKFIAGAGTTFVSTGGLVMVFISFQVRNEEGVNDSGGMQFAITIDGTPQASTIIGGGDLSNDLVQVSRTAIELTAGGFSVSLESGTGPGIRARQTALLCSGIFPVTPGVHRVGLVYRSLVTDADSTPQYVSQREALVFPMWS